MSEEKSKLVLAEIKSLGRIARYEYVQQGFFLRRRKPIMKKYAPKLIKGKFIVCTRARCPVCGTSQKLLADGTIGAHSSDTKKLCPGYRRAPENLIGTCLCGERIEAVKISHVSAKVPRWHLLHVKNLDCSHMEAISWGPKRLKIVEED